MLASPADGANGETSIDAHDGVTVAAWMAYDAGNTRPIYAAISIDGGAFGPPLSVPIEKPFGDVTVRFAPDGTLYIASICDASGISLAPTDICITFSNDRGKSFHPSIRVTAPPADAMNLRDRPWIAVAPDGRLVVSYLDSEIDSAFNFAAPGKLMYTVGSRTGDTVAFEPPREIAPRHMPKAGLYSGTYSMPPAFDVGGRFHGVFEIGDYLPAGGWELRYTRSSAPDLSSTEPPRALFQGLGGFPVTATAGSSSVGVLTYGPTGVVFLRSDDGGETFASPVVLGDPKRSARLPWLAGDETGAFHAVWLDRPTAAAPWTVHYQHLPRGEHEPVIDVATGFSSNDENEQLLGDFIGIAVDHGLPRLAWSEPQDAGHTLVRAAFGRCR